MFVLHPIHFARQRRTPFFSLEEEEAKGEDEDEDENEDAFRSHLSAPDEKFLLTQSKRISVNPRSSRAID